uniref:Uncharacterized protein n=1 Tax=Anguilla anguilla TaxID=7936 RepID=A0A0E9RL21_ANGAN
MGAGELEKGGVENYAENQGKYETVTLWTG